MTFSSNRKSQWTRRQMSRSWSNMASASPTRSIGTKSWRLSPMNDNLYVITTHFNPHRFKSRVRLYRDFERHMEISGAKVLTVEAAFGDHPFEVTQADNPMHVRLRTSSVLWHKERMGNIGFQRLYHLVPDSKNIGFFDSDVSFANPNWVHDTVHKLMHYPVVQPYGTAIN